MKEFGLLHVLHVQTYSNIWLWLLDKIDGALHDGGNDHCSKRLYTGYIDGIRAWLLNNGRAELWSVFTYYSILLMKVKQVVELKTNGNNPYISFTSS